MRKIPILFAGVLALAVMPARSEDAAAVFPIGIAFNGGAFSTRSSGKLYRVCFGNESDKPANGWIHKSIDSRECTLPNKILIGEWIETYGVDSDFVRVRVRGLPPAARSTFERLASPLI